MYADSFEELDNDAEREAAVETEAGSEALEEAREALARKLAADQLRAATRKKRAAARSAAQRAAKKQKIEDGVRRHRFYLGLDLSLQSPGAALYDCATDAWYLLGWRQKPAQAAASFTFKDKATSSTPAVTLWLDAAEAATASEHAFTGRVRRMRARADRMLAWAAALCAPTPADILGASVLPLPKELRGLIHAYSDWSIGPFCLIEEYAYHQNDSSSLTLLAELGGVVRADIERRGWDWVDLNPMMVKSAWAGTGAATKFDMWRALHARWAWPLDRWTGVSVAPVLKTGRPRKDVDTPLQDLVDAVALVHTGLGLPR
jgi:hypothetical protein